MPMTRKTYANTGAQLLTLDDFESVRNADRMQKRLDRLRGVDEHSRLEDSRLPTGEEESLSVDQNQPSSLGVGHDLPPLSEGSIRSSTSSQRSRRHLETAILLAEVEEEKRQNQLRLEEKKAKAEEEKRQNQLRLEEKKAKAEEERLEARKRLIELQNMLEDDDSDKGSGVHSHPSGHPDVETWVNQQGRTGKEPTETMETLHQKLLPKPAPTVDVPNPKFLFAPHITQPDESTKYQQHSEFKCVQQIADSFASTMENLVKSIRPNDDMRKFAARQTSLKDLPDFRGDPVDWPAFIGRFERSTEICGFREEENIGRLQKCLKGDAKEAVSSMLTSTCSVEEILKVLWKRFGRPEQVIKKMVEKARSVPTPTEGNFQSIVDFSIAVKNLCCTAESLNLPLYLNNPQLVEEFSCKLPNHLKLDWGRTVERHESSADLKLLSEFLDEVSSAAVHLCDASSSQQKKNRHRDQCMVVVDLKCPLNCKEAHGLQTCPKFKKMSVDERWDCLKKKFVCFYCLEQGHARPKCTRPFPCGKDGCTGSHHRLLHQQKKDSKVNRDGGHKFNKDGDNSKKDGIVPNQADGHILGVVSQTPSQPANVFMKIVPVQLVGPKGRIIVNAFLDDGSSVTMIDENIADTLGLDGERTLLHLNWLGGRSEHDEKSRLVSFKIRGLNEEEEFELSNVRTKKSLDLPVSPLSNYKQLKKWKHLESVQFPEALPQRPSMLIGSDNCHLLLSRKAVEGPRNSPIACWTYLGWAVCGPSGKSGLKSIHSSMFIAEGMNQDDVLHEMVKEQFRIEALGVVNCQKLPQSKMNIRAETIMESTTRRVGGNFETGMLWKSDELTLPDSKGAALRRLYLMEKKMDLDVEFGSLYGEKIEDYVKKEYCRKLTTDEAEKKQRRVWYLPHFGTVNPNKPGKLRLVFDGAAKVNGISLNDALIQGPDLLSPLINVLMKFRQREIAYSGDIREMFHMVKIRQEDSPALRFLWRGKDRSRPPDVYEMNVMIFGAVSSPYQAQWVKNHNAEEFKDQFPEAVDAIHNRHYVDDYLDSCETPEQAIQKIMQVRDIHRKGGFEIRGWLSNNEDV